MPTINIHELAIINIFSVCVVSCGPLELQETMSTQIYLRMAGYVATFTMHIINLIIMRMNTNQNLATDVKIQAFKGTMYRYFTCWTVGLQIFYAFLGLFCDIMILKNSNNKKYKLPKQLSGLRNITFAALVWPCTFVVCIVFWTVFNYDRSLIFPFFLDKILSKTTNHILHSAIVPIALWEVIFRPRTEPKSHKRNLLQLTFHMVVYMCVLYYTYYERGIWLYPMFKVTYGTFNFVLIHIIIALLCLVSYYLQWFLNSLIHGKVKTS